MKTKKRFHKPGAGASELPQKQIWLNATSAFYFILTRSIELLVSMRKLQAPAPAPKYGKSHTLIN